MVKREVKWKRKMEGKKWKDREEKGGGKGKGESGESKAERGSEFV